MIAFFTGALRLRDSFANGKLGKHELPHIKGRGTGWSRSGTAAMREALIDLGYTVHHMVVIMTYPNPHTGEFERAYDGEDVDWDKIYEDFNAAVDYPTCGFYKVLMQKYPDAKIIHTTRDAEKWYKSAFDTIHKFLKELPDDIPEQVKIGAHLMQKNTFDGDFQGKFEDKEAMLQIFKEHEEDVRRSVPADRLLVFETGVDGWEKLCTFLGKDIPKKPWPHLNTTEDFQKSRERVQNGEMPEDHISIQNNTAK